MNMFSESKIQAMQNEHLSGIVLCESATGLPRFHDKFWSRLFSDGPFCISHLSSISSFFHLPPQNARPDSLLCSSYKYYYYSFISLVLPIAWVCQTVHELWETACWMLNASFWNINTFSISPAKKSSFRLTVLVWDAEHSSWIILTCTKGKKIKGKTYRDWLIDREGEMPS